MAKRFIDTDFYKSPFVRGLKAPLKGLYCFIICDCSGAGIWVKDLEVASLYIGTKITESDWNENFVKTKKAIDLKDGKFFFPDFIEHQYPKGLSDKNPAQKNFIEELKRYDLLDENLNIKQRVSEDPLKTLQRVSEDSPKTLRRVLGNGNGNGNGNGKSPKNQTIVFPYNSERFLTMWYAWKEYRRKQHGFEYKSEESEQAALKKVSNLSQNEDEAIEIIEQSISAGWKGFFELNKNKNDQKYNNNSISNYRRKAVSAILNNVPGADIN